ncbi:MAG: hypothetical protein ACYDIB_07405 [Desulfobulbia bacterium]
MDIKIAAAETAECIDGATLPEINPEYGRDHLREMCEKIVRGEVTGEKAHRWLGWVQGCVCFGGGATLAELKDINHKA